MDTVFHSRRGYRQRFFVSTWIYETPDRQLDREVRRTNLVSAARQILNPINERVEPTYSVQWAIHTLSNLNEPIDIQASYVNLAGLYLPCGEYRITAQKLSLYFTSIDRASIAIWSDDVTFGAVVRKSAIAFRNAPLTVERSHAPIQLMGSRIIDSHLTFENSAELWLSALHSSQVSTWLGTIQFDNFHALEMVSIPSPNGLYDIPEHALSIFEQDDLEASMANIKTRSGTKLNSTSDTSSYDFTGFNFVLDQKHGLVDLTQSPPGISEQFKTHCSMTGGEFLCHRPEPAAFANPLPELHSSVPCSRRNSNFSYDPFAKDLFSSE